MIWEGETTTICYRNGTLAADSGVWVGETLLCRMKKLYRLKDGSICGFCGNIDGALKLIRILDGGKRDEKTDKINEEVEILLVTPSRRIMTFAGNISTVLKPSKTEYIALGSGRDFALGAMYNGASATEAVRAAIAHDAKSTGPVVSMELK